MAPPRLSFHVIGRSCPYAAKRYRHCLSFCWLSQEGTACTAVLAEETAEQGGGFRPPCARQLLMVKIPAVAVSELHFFKNFCVPMRRDEDSCSFPVSLTRALFSSCVSALHPDFSLAGTWGWDTLEGLAAQPSHHW